MILSEAFAGKRYAVLGLARSGLAAVETLLGSGARVTAWDNREEPRRALEGRGFEVTTAGSVAEAEAALKTAAPFL